MAEHLTSENFSSFVAASPLPVLVDFYKDGCLPCRRIAPLVSKAETEYAGKLTVARVNVTQYAQLAEAQQIIAAPMLVLFKDGTEIARHRGVITRDELKEFITQVL